MNAHLKYLSYVIRHKWFVFVAGLRTGAPIWRLVIHDWSKFTLAEWGPYVRYFYTPPQIGEFVDGVCDNCPISGHVVGIRPSTMAPPGKWDVKISPDAECSQPGEFWAWPYEYDRPTVQAAFDAAWLHHQHLNAHHWQHWVLREDSGATKVLEMPEPLVREMVADWMGAGRAITGRWEAAGWYEKNKEKMLLHEVTRLIVEILLAPTGEQPSGEGGA